MKLRLLQNWSRYRAGSEIEVVPALAALLIRRGIGASAQPASAPQDAPEPTPAEPAAQEPRRRGRPRRAD